MTAPIDKLAIWFAGFFDGEGAIMIAKWHEARYDRTYYALRLDVSNTDLSVLGYIKEKFGGNLGPPRSEPLHPNSKPVYHWFTAYKEAYTILKRIVPYLVLKQEKANLALKFYEEQKAWLKRPTPVNKLSDEELERREILYQSMKELNRKGIKTLVEIS